MLLCYILGFFKKEINVIIFIFSNHIYQSLLSAANLEDNSRRNSKKELLSAGKVIPESRYKKSHHSKESH